MGDRCAIFIDGGYLDKVLQTLFHGKRIDYVALPRALCPSREILRTYYYTCEPWQSNPTTEAENLRFSGQQKFLAFLRRIPNYEVRLGRLAFRGTDKETNEPIFEQKEVDVRLAIELVRLTMHRSITQAILITNDSDFVPAIQLAKDEGVEVILATGGKPYVSLLNAADRIMKIDVDMLNSIERKEITSPT